jgi:Ser-tRNA(Ala) deacylase AlaX
MSNIYLKQPQLLTNLTEIRKARRFDTGEVAVAFGQNIVRPATGGQPHDHATVTVGAETFRSGRVFKADGDTWVSLDGAGHVPELGEMAYVEVNAERRRRLSRGHTLTHLLMAASRHVVAGFDSKGAAIDDNERTVSVRFRTHSKLTEKQISTIDALTRHFVLKDAPVTFSMVKSAEAGAQKFPKWRIDSELGLSGSIRVVDIRGIDANPCSGSHVGKTGEVAAFAMRPAAWSADEMVTLNAELTPDWTYWFPHNFLIDAPAVDLSSFEP